MRSRLAAMAVVFAVLVAAQAQGEFRFPMPEFESGYQYPPMSTPPPSRIPVPVDIAVLAAALGLTSFAVLRMRSRRLVFVLSVASLIYFGFYRKGCVCPVGSVQNVFEMLVGRSAGLPVVVAVFFLLPLVFALYFGRVFCAAVCPLGAAQEMCAIHPVQVPRSVESVLGILPYAYLGLVGLAIATGSGYLICRYDPFVGFFRRGASFPMLLTGGALLLLGIFIARPYCRYLCPYGVLLRWASRFSKWHASVTPAECTQCRLCEDACPYGAIVYPTPAHAPLSRKEGVRRLGVLLAVTPLIIAAGALAGYGLSEPLARMHPAVWLAERLGEEETGKAPDGTPIKLSLEVDAFEAGQKSADELYAEAGVAAKQFKPLAAFFGAFMGLVISGRLIRLSVVRKRKDYEADRAACLSCARCFKYCPVEKKS
jgi:NosR/NirI family nitrous oxide reductase transcriptional regulator